MPDIAQDNLIEEFTRLVNESRGQVAFITDQGDRLVANSMLSALVGFSTILAVAQTLDLQLDCEYAEDCERILAFLKKYRLGRHTAGNAGSALR